MATTTFDATGMICPLPVLRANKVLKSLEAGDELEVLATDAAAPQDFKNYCKQTGHTLVNSEEGSDGTYRILIRKAG
jgi:tRNA 2-thiouridine synthesizing protein A